MAIATTDHAAKLEISRLALHTDNAGKPEA